MPHLSSLAPADADLVAGLPYRVGIWMSRVDLEGGPEFNPAELKALEEILVATAAQHGTVTGAIARETLKRKSHWADWTNTAPKVLDECEGAIGLLHKVLSHGDLLAYRQWLLKIAAVVAAAFGEFGDGEDHSNAIGRAMNKVTEFMTGDIPTGNSLHISPAENDALGRLSKALGL